MRPSSTLSKRKASVRGSQEPNKQRLSTERKEKSLPPLTLTHRLKMFPKILRFHRSQERNLGDIQLAKKTLLLNTGPKLRKLTLRKESLRNQKSRAMKAVKLVSKDALDKKWFTGQKEKQVRKCNRMRKEARADPTNRWSTSVRTRSLRKNQLSKRTNRLKRAKRTDNSKIVANQEDANSKKARSPRSSPLPTRSTRLDTGADPTKRRPLSLLRPSSLHFPKNLWRLPNKLSTTNRRQTSTRRLML
jgi:hypothetical protein